MAEELARLELAQEITTASGAIVHTLVVYRPTCKAMMDIIASNDGRVQVERFVGSSVRAFNGTGEPLEIATADMLYNDINELSGIIFEIYEEAAAAHLPPDTGDGIKTPLVYTLRRPVKIAPGEGAETLTQIAFQAKKMREITDFLDAVPLGETAMFRAFMRTWSTPMGVTVPMWSDNLIDAIDYLDALIIRGPQIMGKFTRSQNKWKRTSSLLP